MTHWSVVQTKPQCEQLVRNRLMRSQIETYLPKIKIHGRIALLFPAYLFVRIAESFYEVRWTDGVIRLLMAGEQPARLADEVIMDIRKREVGGYVKLPKRNILKKGDKLQITNGSFAGHIGVCDGMGSRERVRILLELLGRQVPVELPDTAIMPLDVVAR
jgi:transcriptional antiterminator RfaH